VPEPTARLIYPGFRSDPLKESTLDSPDKYPYDVY
jgi:hypothetical protein